MKKILIVNNNFLIGGIQKALIEMVKKIANDYEITILCFQNIGELKLDIPENVKVVETKSLYKYLGKSQSSWKFFGKIKRAILVLMTRLFNFSFVAPILNASISKNEKNEHYDIAISYMQNSGNKSFYGGTADYVLQLNADKKLQFIHCDYEFSGTRCGHNDILYSKYDRIVCVSESVKYTFLKLLPELKEKTTYLYNAIDEEKILSLSQINSFEYDKSYINFISVARLSKEKGIDRAVEAFAKIKESGIKFRYYVVGDGQEKSTILSLIEKYELTDSVFLLGEKTNPYAFMKNADYLLVPSRHEAAPIVFQEAKVLKLPIITTETISAKEMVGDTYGHVVTNSLEGIENVIKRISITNKIWDYENHDSYIFIEHFNKVIAFDC